jgi:hypothetical protein
LYIHSIDLTVVTVLVTVLIAVLAAFSIVLLIRSSTDDDKEHKSSTRTDIVMLSNSKVHGEVLRLTAINDSKAREIVHLSLYLMASRGIPTVGR